METVLKAAHAYEVLGETKVGIGAIDVVEVEEPNATVVAQCVEASSTDSG